MVPVLHAFGRKLRGMVSSLLENILLRCWINRFLKIGQTVGPNFSNCVDLS
jgi:hypothetical protein